MSKRFLLPLICAALVALAAAPAAASADPIWEISQQHYPTNFAPGGTGTIVVHLENRGTTATSGPFTIVTTLPPGMTATASGDGFHWICDGTTVVICENDPANFPSYSASPVASFGTFGPDLSIIVDVDPSASGTVTNTATVSGGGTAVEATTSAPIGIGSETAEFGAVPESFKAKAVNQDGSLFTQAGGHPFAVTSEFQVASKLSPDGVLVPVNGVKDIDIDLPAGFVGNPRAAELCPASGITTGATKPCPMASQVGVIHLVLTSFGFRFDGTVPIYNMKPADDELAAFGFNLVAPIHISVRVRGESDYGVTATVKGVSEAYALLGAKITLWGNPADPAHDPRRLGPASGLDWGHPTNSPPKPFLTNPFDCSAGLPSTTMRMVSYDEPDVEKAYTSTVSEEIDGCEKLSFGPSVDFSPDNRVADSPTGLEVGLTFPQHSNVNGLDVAPMKRTEILLPDGMTISPSAADGLEACSDAQLGAGTTAPAACPDASKIGTATARTPVLEDPLEGAVYVGSQLSGDPESGEMFRVFLVLKSRKGGLVVRLKGQVAAGAQTGRLRAVFDGVPQLPVSDVSVRFKSGPRAPLATSSTCGASPAEWQMTSWGGQVVSGTAPAAVDERCGPKGFWPSFAAGSVSPTGGAFSPFAIRIVRADGQQTLSGVHVDMPEGLLAKLAGVPLCGSSQAAAGGCPADSRVGTATVGAGPGANPFFLTGDVYLTEGYKGAPYGLAVHVHVKAGPFDLGWVRVRQALYVDPDTAKVSVVSDPLPQIVKGVPVRLGAVNVDVDRPGFTVNPTSCAEKQVATTLTSFEGATHRTGTRFQVGDCTALPFRPRLAMRLAGKRQMRTGGHPALSAVMTQATGQANIRQARVRLPKNVVLDARNAYDPELVCGYDAALKADCPAGSAIGKANLKTPLLNRALTGRVHLVQGIRFGPTGNRIRTLPTLLVKLRGEVAINLRAKTAIRGGHLTSTFRGIPDAAASRFSLRIDGGKDGILVVTRSRKGKFDLCDASQRALVQMDGQNGKRADYPVRVKTPCAKKKKVR